RCRRYTAERGPLEFRDTCATPAPQPGFLACDAAIPPTAKMRVGPGGCRGMMPSVDKTAITADLASRLVAAQFPQWAGLPVRRVEPGGWANVTFSLGADLSVRLPSGPWYAQQVEKEHRWLPVLARQLPLPIPQPLGRGLPGCGFPWPWSVYRWLPGTPLA